MYVEKVEVIFAFFVVFTVVKLFATEFETKGTCGTSQTAETPLPTLFGPGLGACFAKAYIEDEIPTMVRTNVDIKNRNTVSNSQV